MFKKLIWWYVDNFNFQRFTMPQKNYEKSLYEFLLHNLFWYLIFAYFHSYRYFLFLSIFSQILRITSKGKFTFFWCLINFTCASLKPKTSINSIWQINPIHTASWKSMAKSRKRNASVIPKVQNGTKNSIGIFHHQQAEHSIS